MYIIDAEKFTKAAREKGYQSIAQLASSLGVHRNTVHYYLSGHGVFPSSLDKLLETLDLSPNEIIVKKKSENSSNDKIASLVDILHKEFPDVSFVLFGSRARGVAGKYSDWDIGVFSKEGLKHDVYRRVVRRKNDLVENFPFSVDIVNLNRTSEYFLQEASKGWTFLTGRVSDWIELKRKAAS